MIDRDRAIERTPDQEINLLNLLLVLMKRKILILAVTVTAAILSIGFSLMLKNTYTATSRILPPQKEGSGLSALLNQGGGLAALAAGGLGGGSDLYVSILKSRSVADDVIKKLDLISRFKAKNIDVARKILATRVSVQSEKFSGIVTITAKDKDPKRAAELANTFVEELGRTTARLNLTKAGTERLFLEKRLGVVKDALQKAEEELKSFSQMNRIVHIDSQSKASIEGIARLKADLASKEVQLSVLRSYQTDASSDVKSLQTAIKRLHVEIDRLAGAGSGGEGIPSIGNVPGVGLEYARRVRDMKVQEAVFEQLTKQYEVAKLNEAKDSSMFQVIDSADVPSQKSGPQRSRIVVLATVTAFFFSLVLAFVLEYMRNLSDSEKVVLEDVKRHLFTVPKFKIRS